MSREIIQPLIQQLNTIQLQGGNNVLDIFRLRGVMDGTVYDSNGAPYDLGQDDGGDLVEWDNVPYHCFRVMAVTDTLAEHIGLSRQSRIIQNIAGFFHDSGKKTERNWQRAIENSDGTLFEEESLPDIQSRRQVAFDNVSEMELWENAEYGIPPDATYLMKAVNPQTEHGHNTLEEKIMWLADACVRGVTIMSVDERISSTESDPINGPKNIAYSEMFRPQFNGKSLYEVQRELGTKYVREFAPFLGVKETEFFSKLNELVSEKINSGNLPLLDPEVLDNYVEIVEASIEDTYQVYTSVPEFNEHDLPSYEMYREWFEGKTDLQSFIAYIEGKPVGFVIGYKFDKPRFQERGNNLYYMDYAGILPEYRKKGVHSKLVTRLEYEAKQKQYDEFHFRTWRKRVAMQRWATNAGYTILDVEQRPNSEEDRIDFVKLLH